MTQVHEKAINYKRFWKDLTSGRFVSMVRESAKGESVANSTEVFNIMKPIYARHSDIEIVYGIFLDARNHILSIEALFTGTITSSTIYCREIVKIMIRLKASALVLLHNHPAGSVTPSAEDMAITRKVYVALSSIDALLHDHIIIGDRYYSFSDTGNLELLKKEYFKLIQH